MKSLLKILSFLAVALLCSPSAFLHAKEKSVGKESLGKIAEGQKADDLVGLLGKPASKGKVTQMDATGEWVQEWKYPALGVRLSVDNEGEVLAASNVVMGGYWEQPDQTAEAIHDGWFHTGDGGTIDDAVLRFSCKSAPCHAHRLPRAAFSQGTAGRWHR